MTRRVWVLAAAVIFLVIGVWAGRATAHHGKVHFTKYHSVNAPSWMPSTIAIRCRGWAEDTAGKLVLIGFLEDRAVYRCLRGAEV